MRSPNFLILDEPTNDLDITTLGILEDYIAKFKGCVIIVSHDRFFLDRTVEHLFVFEGNGVVKDFPGNYSDYREWKLLKQQEEKRQTQPQAVKPSRPVRDNSNKLSYKERKELESLTEEIAALENEKTEIETALSGGNISVEDITIKSKRLSDISGILDEKEMRWLELSEKE